MIDSVDISYQVDRLDNSVTVTHKYLDKNGLQLNTIIGMHPMHWKFSENYDESNYKIRSARSNKVYRRKLI